MLASMSLPLIAPPPFSCHVQSSVVDIEQEGCTCLNRMVGSKQKMIRRKIIYAFDIAMLTPSHLISDVVKCPES